MKKTRLLFARYLTLLVLALLSTNLVWGEDYEELFTITSGDVVSNSGYAKYEKTINERGWIITFGGNNKSVGTNSGNRSNCKLSSYSKYAVSPVTTSDVASAFVSTTSISDVSKISYTISGGNNQTSTNVYLIYSSDGNTFSQMSLTSGTQGAAISSGTAYEFTKCSGYFGLLFKATNSSGNWRIDDVNITFYKGQSAPATVEAPTFTPAETEFWEFTSVSLACATEGASIYYTLDGTDPTKSSTPYTEAINISETTTIKAIAYKGDDASSVASKTYTKIVPLTTMDAIFNASATTGNYWIIFNNWVVSGVKNSNAYITDNAGKGLIVYTSSHGFEVGDKLSGTVMCALTKYNGSAEITNLTSTTEGLTVTKNGTLNAVDATIANLGCVNTGAYINLGALTYNGTEFTDGTNTIKPYNTFITLPTLTNGKKYYVKGVYIQYNSTKEIAPLTEEDFAEVPATEYDITITPCENGYVTVDAENNKAQEGQVVTLTITPDKGYKLGTLTVTDESSNPITVSEENKFTMPASDVTVSATFTEIPTHEAKFFVNGVQYGETQNVLEGDEVEFPEEDPAAIGTRLFVGWTASQMPSASDEAPDFVESATMDTEDLNFYAVYAKKTEGGGNYEKVTTAPADWCGKYLIVYETENVAFDGSLETLDAASNTKAVEITDNIIASSEAMDAIAFTVAYKTGSSTVYSLKSASGYYISGTTTKASASNGLKQADTDEDYEISFNGTTIESKSSNQQMQLKYNKDTNQKRFRFYKSGQQDIALYKKQEASYSGYCTDVPVTATITSTGYATFSCDYALDLDKLPEGLTAYYATYTTGASVILMKVAEGAVAAKTGLFLKGTAETSYDIPVAATGTTIDENILEPTTGAELQIGDYVYMKADGKFHPLGSALAVSKGKAYIPASKIDGEPAGISFEGSITGIEEIESQSTVNGQQSTAVYNLQGIRVATPKKGKVYIMNGKKYVCN